MSINLKLPDIKELKPKITVFGVGGAGGNAVNNMIRSGLEGVEFVVANTDSQALMSSQATRRIQMGVAVTEGLGAGSMPEIGRAAAEEVIDEITDHLSGAHMIFVTAGMGGGTGTGAAPVIARAAREHGILTVGVVTKPFQFEGARRMRVAEAGIADLQENVDTLIVIPNQNLFRIANDKTTFADAFAMADQVLFSGVACITDLMVKEGLINLDFADVRSVMREMGKAMMGTGEASGERRAQQAAEAAIANPLLDETSMSGAKGLLISITGGRDLTLFEVDEAATRIREEVDPDANIILGATFDENLEGIIRVSVVATGIENEEQIARPKTEAPVVRQVEPRQRPAATPPVSNRAAEASRRPVARANPAPADAPAAMAAAAVAAAVSTQHDQAMQQPIARAPISRPAASDPDVHIAPLTIQSAEFAAAQELDPEPQAPVDRDELGDGPFIPPTADSPSPRMPRVQDFPAIVQRQLAPKGEDGAGPMSLLKRLAHASLGGRREEAAAPAAPQNPAPPRQPAPAQRPAQATRPQAPQAPQAAPARTQQVRPQAAPAQAAHRPAAAPPTARPQPGMYRPVEGNLDPHGRTAPPRDARMDDGELEIPAFLRRQAN